jgi:stage III sporulation protein AH
MINKQKLWFLTLFSLILVLSIYYITMPKEVFESKKENEVNKENDNKVNIEISDSSSLDVLRVSDDEARLKEIEDLRIVLTNVDSSIDEKNKAYEKLKLIEQNKGKEESLEDKIKSEFNLNSYVKINNNQIKITVVESKHNYELANNIIRSIQEEYNEKMYITVKFQS